MIETTGNDLVVIASDPKELVESQHAVIANVGRKIDETKRDLAEAKDILSAANMAKIDASAAKRLVKKKRTKGKD